MAARYADLWGQRPGAGGAALNGSEAAAPKPHALSGVVSLQRLLDLYAMPCVVDMLDVDIQGNECATRDRLVETAV